MVHIPISTEELAEKLSIAGFEVEAIDNRSSNASGVVVGFVESKEKHPNADKLSICKVDIGMKTPLQIVCGAPNVRSGIHVPVATVGSYLPAKDLNIKASQLRGVSSEGMICSQGELGLNVNEEGICIFENLSGPFPSIGEPVSEFFGLNDTVLELAITANRSDGMSMIGIAKEVSAITRSNLSLPTIEENLKFKSFQSEEIKSPIIEKGGLYSLTLIEDIKCYQDSNKLIKQRIESAGIKSINLIVDITNYVMLEQGQPLHAFDADLLEKITKKKVNIENFGIRNAYKGEKFISLGGKEISLSEASHVVTCHNLPIALAGVIGSNNCAVNNQTKRVWLEAAVFSPVSVRNTSRDIAIRTESSSRYEKGIPSELTLLAANRAINILKENNECSLTDSWVFGAVSITEKQILLRRSRVHKLLGNIKLSLNESNDILEENKDKSIRKIRDDEIEQILCDIGCTIQTIDIGWNVNIDPSRKNDLQREVDLIEEIARLIGFDRFESNLPHPIRPGVLNPKQKAERYLREYLCASGLQEVSSFSLVGKIHDVDEMVAITNPLLSETSHLRTNLWLEHLNICQRNLKAGRTGCWIFEIGNIYKRINNDINQELILSGIICGENRLEMWSANKGNIYLNYYEARGKLTELFDKFKINISDKQIIADNILHPGKAANLILEGKEIGSFGQLHPAITDERSLPIETYMFQMNLNPILVAATRKKAWNVTYKQFSTIPFLERDIALIVNKDITSKLVVQLILKVGKPLIEKVELIDRFEEEKIGVDKCSLAFRIWYRDKSKTLNDEDVKPIHEKVRKELIKSLNAELRS